MNIRESSILSENSNNVKLNVVSSGHAIVDENWRDTVMNSTFSRIYFILKGSFQITDTSGEVFDFSENGVFIIPSGYSYSYSCMEEMEHVFFHVRLSSFGKTDLLRSLTRPLGFSADLSDKEKYINLALGEKTLDAVLAEAELFSAIARFLEENNVSVKNTKYTFGICEAIKYIEENLSVQLTLEEIARAVHLAPSTMTRLFRKETGMSVGEYLDNLIMQGAEEKLRFSEMSVGEISEHYGFCDQFYFSRRFKEKYGASPREYRRSVIL